MHFIEQNDCRSSGVFSYITNSSGVTPLMDLTSSLIAKNTSSPSLDHFLGAKIKVVEQIFLSCKVSIRWWHGSKVFKRLRRTILNAKKNEFKIRNEDIDRLLTRTPVDYFFVKNFFVFFRMFKSFF